jgi:hypothetical protein
VPALDRQPLLWAYENDVKVFNYGGTRGWYSDGVFRYKRSWGAGVSRRSRISSVWRVVLGKPTPETTRCLRCAGLLVEVRRRFFAVLAAVDSASALAEDLGVAQKNALAGLYVPAPHGRGATVDDLTA